ncbi:MAG TPA: YraN family protein [Candidatus Deferrimicrobiaceae bacterium]|jgi:putative endonuclease
MSAPPDPRHAAGREAEGAAAGYLESLGMTIVGRNVRTGGGEIDLVARDGGTLVFVEVRYRESDAFGTPEDSVGVLKRLRVARAARRYLAEIGPSGWTEARFDVVAVEGGETPALRHFQGAFDARGKVL